MTTTPPARTADISFWFDPVCPFAWITSQWIRKVAAQRDYAVDWRFISLRLINAGVDYATHFPAGYEDGPTSGLRLLRVAARTRSEHGPDVIGPLYEAFSSEIFDSPRAAQLTPQVRGSREFAEPLLARAGLPAGLDHALSLTGRDVGPPIIQFQPPDGVAFFGPVISRVPGDQDAVRLWDHVTGLAAFPGFAELTRSLRERPQLASFGAGPDQAGAEEDWHGGSRRSAG